MQILPSGRDGLLLELGSLDEVLDRYAALQAADLPVLDLVPAGRTILVVAERGTDLDALARQLHLIEPVAAGDRPGAELSVPVSYDGADLAGAAEELGCSTEELVRRHQAETWTVAFCGFAPGFGYMARSDERLAVPRRTNPRTRVPPGSVAVAGGFSSVYPRESPGGWQLIGRTDLVAWDLDRDPPALFSPGVRVRFVEAR